MAQLLESPRIGFRAPCWLLLSDTPILCEGLPYV
jgi:hypothetical protein